MREPDNNVPIQSAAITDRGLSEKRPLNEDSFLADTQRRIFAVADGVGGAQAGEVASQTAMEVLDEAFRHQVNGADIEDLMEIAIQRANSSIHRMAREHPKLSMMATTVVALHLDGRTATIGHVGDSRLYRISPAGKIYRETADHSVVEEEVRAGRMTADQAANHPSRNVISRALGAEDSVEVDLKTIEVEDGTTFLLCSDGITRHISDEEIRETLTTERDLEKACAELKRRCYERGAEDNLTALLVRVGAPAQDSAGGAEDDERTIMSERPAFASALSGGGDERAIAHPSAINESNLTPPSRTAFPAKPTQENSYVPSAGQLTWGGENASEVATAPRRKGGGALARLLFFVLLIAVGAGAFYGGMLFKQRETDALNARASATPAPVPTPVVEDPASKFAKRQRQVDQAPANWITNDMKSETTAQGIQNPLDSNDPEFLYLYGRARLLSGDYEEAVKALEKAVDKAGGTGAPPDSAEVNVEARLALAAAALKLDRTGPRVRAFNALDGVIKKGNQ